MVEKKSWEQFRDSGLLWWINTILHMFGWAIVINLNENEVVEAYPARVKYRGFSESDNTAGYIKVSKYLEQNAKILREESEE